MSEMRDDKRRLFVFVCARPRELPSLPFFLSFLPLHLYKEMGGNGRGRKEGLGAQGPRRAPAALYHPCAQGAAIAKVDTQRHSDTDTDRDTQTTHTYKHTHAPARDWTGRKMKRARTSGHHLGPGRRAYNYANKHAFFFPGQQ